MSHIAVIDIGKTNAKLVLVHRETLEEIAVLTRPNTVIDAPPWPHFDVDGHWKFLLDGLSAFHTQPWHQRDLCHDTWGLCGFDRQRRWACRTYPRLRT